MGWNSGVTETKSLDGKGWIVYIYNMWCRVKSLSTQNYLMQ